MQEPHLLENLSFSGVLGKRTRFQQKDLAQLVVKASIEEDQDDRNTFFLDELKDSCPGMAS